jgi:hypothetical protein
MRDVTVRSNRNSLSMCSRVRRQRIIYLTLLKGPETNPHHEMCMANLHAHPDFGLPVCSTFTLRAPILASSAST